MNAALSFPLSSAVITLPSSHHLCASGSHIFFILLPHRISFQNVALQTFLAVPLGAIVPGACLAGAAVLSKLD